MRKRSLAAIALFAATGCRGLLGFEDPLIREPPDAPPDPPPDGDPGQDCPAGYVAIGLSISRYRIIATPDAFQRHHDDCNADTLGATHLAAIDDANELVAIDAVLDQLGAPAERYFIGAIQRRDQADPITGWLSFTGGPLPNLWSAGQPNDTDGVENNLENFGLINRTTSGLHDAPPDFVSGAVCECDGRAIAPEVLTLLPGD